MSARRELAAAAVLCAAGAGLILLAAGRPWVHAVADLPQPLPPARYVLTGRELAPQTTGLGLAGLAGLAGMVAARGAVRAVVGLLLALMGVGVAVFSAAAVRADHVAGAVAGRASAAGEGLPVTTAMTPWWVPSVVGGVLLFAAGVLAVVRGGGWPGMSGRYDRPGTPRAPGRPQTSEPPEEASAMWDSLDRGADPTVDTDVGRGSDSGKEN
ncbi:MAG: MFS transporter [Streptosporangiales bacterium]|nr:MFS transporter [Streptosporangiales bacterium]